MGKIEYCAEDYYSDDAVAAPRKKRVDRSVIGRLPKAGKFIVGSSEKFRKKEQKLFREWDERLMREGLPAAKDC